VSKPRINHEGAKAGQHSSNPRSGLSSGLAGSVSEEYTQLMPGRFIVLVLPLLLGACSGQRGERPLEEPPSEEPASEEPASCSDDADCRLFSSGLCGCRCMALGSSEEDPACARRTDMGVNCFANPCTFARARCGRGSHQCTVSLERPPPEPRACERDSQCRVLTRPCDCTCEAWHIDTLPTHEQWAFLCEGQPGRNCGVRSPCANLSRSARCDSTTHRCVMN